VTRTRDFRGTLENVDVQAVPGVGHLSIDKNQIMQQKVINAIEAAVRHPTTASSAAQTLQQREVSAARQSAGTGAAAARN
jgi:hypothetical protein